MADWSKPTTASLYADFVAEVNGRLNDAVALLSGAATNLPIGSMKFDRATSKFQEWDGAAFVDKLLSIAGGGTGSASAAGARANLGLGTIAVQNANAVAIVGGTIGGITALGLNGDLTFVADNVNKIGTNANRPSTIYVRSGMVIPVGVDKFVTS